MSVRHTTIQRNGRKAPIGAWVGASILRKQKMADSGTKNYGPDGKIFVLERSEDDRGAEAWYRWEFEGKATFDNFQQAHEFLKIGGCEGTVYAIVDAVWVPEVVARMDLTKRVLS